MPHSRNHLQACQVNLFRLIKPRNKRGSLLSSSVKLLWLGGVDREPGRAAGRVALLLLLLFSSMGCNDGRREEGRASWHCIWNEVVFHAADAAMRPFQTG